MAERWRYRYVSEMLGLYRRAFSVTAAGGTVRLSWGGREYDADGWRRQFRAALDRRITLKAGPSPAWRKLDPLYQTELARDCQRIRDASQKRVRIYQIATPELRRRFGHLLSTMED